MNDVIQVEIFEHSNTYGFGWRIPEENKSHWSFHAPGIFVTQVATWADAQKNPVDALLNTRVTQVERMPDFPGAYGGKKKCVRVHVKFLNEYCTEYWDDKNSELSARRQESPVCCHYCGLPASASATGSFSEPVCDGCN